MRRPDDLQPVTALVCGSCRRLLSAASALLLLTGLSMSIFQPLPLWLQSPRSAIADACNAVAMHARVALADCLEAEMEAKRLLDIVWPVMAPGARDYCLHIAQAVMPFSFHRLEQCIERYSSE